MATNEDDLFLDDWMPEFEDVDVTGSNDTSAVGVIPATGNSPTFSTASGKTITIAKESLIRARGILESVACLNNFEDDELSGETILCPRVSSKMSNLSNPCGEISTQPLGANTVEKRSAESQPSTESFSISSCGNNSGINNTQHALTISTPKCKRFNPPRRIPSLKRSRSTTESNENTVSKSPKLSNQLPFAKASVTVAKGEENKNLSAVESNEIFESSIALLADEGWDD